MKTPEAVRAINYTPSIGNFLTMVLLSFCAIMLLPRQFHVSVVENSSDAEVGRARWLFPLYLVAINLFVIPIALAGLITFPFGAVDSDMYVLALPMEGNAPLLSVGVFVGGLSAATAMVIVECVALSIMVSNDIVVPLVLQRGPQSPARQKDFGDFLLRVRRFAIFAIMAMAYLYYRALGNTQLAAIGLLSFAAIAQLAPAFFGGLFWRRATARGAIGGMLVGVAVWIYTLFLPSFLDGSTAGLLLLQHGPFGIEALRPQALFGADLPPLLHGVLWSLSLNVLTYVVLSLARQPSSIERLQADLFVPNALAPMAPTVPALAHHRDGAGHSEHGGAVSGARSRPAFVRGVRAHPQRRSRSGRAGRFRTAAARRTSDRLLDRRGLLAAGDVAAAAQAHRLRQGGAETARRLPRRASFQSRDTADRAEPRAAGHRRVRRGSAADLLEPAVRRNSRAAAASRPDRDSACGKSSNSWARSALPASARATATRCWKCGWPPTPPKASRIWNVCPTVTW